MNIKELFFKITKLILIIYFIIIGYFYFIQNNYIYFPQKITKNYADNIIKDKKNIEEINIETEANVIIRGWYRKSNNNLKTNLVIYFGGNSEEVSYLIEDGKFGDYSILTMNYRGFGLSDGKPNEKNLLADALKIYDYVLKRKDIDKNKIIIMGRSLGTGVATYLASKINCQAVILTSPYDSLVSVAQEKMPFLPIDLISKNRYDSISLAPKIKYPLLGIAASDDTTIPTWHSKKLLDSWGGRTKYTIIEKEDHDSIISNVMYWKIINNFLRELNK